MELMAGAAVGLTLPATAHAAPADVGVWSPVYGLGFIPIHCHLLPNGKMFLLQDDMIIPIEGQGMLWVTSSIFLPMEYQVAM
jgi:hypothetical protein